MEVGEQKSGVRERLENLAMKWGKQAMSQGIKEASKSTKGKETDFSLKLPEGTQSSQHFDFGLVRPILGF